MNVGVVPKEQTMNVNGLPIPRALLDAIESKEFSREAGSVPLKEEKDSFGNKLETEIGELYATKEMIQRETGKLPDSFKADGVYGEESEYSNWPGSVDDIVDFNCILAFALSSDGAPFCLDYRQNCLCPSVLWWDDVYWRKVSETVDDFLFLFAPCT